MAPVRPTEDYYAVLGLPSTASIDEIKKKYRVLSLERHPDRTGGSTAAFQLLNDANETLTDPVKREYYDKKVYPNLNGQNGSSPSSRSPSPELSEWEKFMGDLLSLQLQIDALRSWKDRQVWEKSQLSAQLNKLQEDIRLLREQDAEENNFISNCLRWMTTEPEEAKNQREKARSQRHAALKFKGADPERILEGIKVRDEMITTTERNIAALEAQLLRILNAHETRMREKWEEYYRKEYDMFRRERGQYRRASSPSKATKEALAKMQEELRKKQEEEEQRKKEDADARAKKQEEEKAAKPCGHRAAWKQVDGQHKCSRCGKVQQRFAFQCPGCEKVACGNCRDAMQGGGGKKGKGKSRR